MTTIAKIHTAARQRSENWASHPRTDPGVTRQMTDRLGDLYGELRLERARNQHGDPAEIRRRARIEREIERLMSDNGE
jgi:hypothetical protein